MAIQHFYSQTVADGTATSVVRPSDWNSVHNQVLNMGGNTAGTSQISGADIVWAGGNNVTLSANGSTVSIVGPTVPAQTVQTQASGNIVGQGFTTTTAAGAVVAGTANSAGVLMAVPGFLTTAAQSNHSHNFATTTTNGGVIVVGTTNSAGATIGVPAFLTTAAATDVTSGRAGVGTTFAGTGVAASMTLNTAGLNLAISELVGTDTWYATGANTIAGTNTSGTFSNDGYVVSGAGILSVGVSNNTLILSVPAGGGAGDGGNTLAVAGSTAGSNSLVLFSNSPTVTFGMNGNTITASAAGGGGGGVTMGKWEPFYPAGTTTSTPGLNSIYLQKLRPDANVSFSFIERRMSNNFSSTTIAQTAGYTLDYGLYSRGAGTNSTRMELMGSSQMFMAVSMSSSTVTVQVAQGAATYSLSSVATNPLTLLTGYKHLYMPYTNTLSAGQEYWFAQRMSSSGATNALRMGLWEQTVINNNTVGKIFGSTLLASNASYVGDFNQGVYGTTSGAFPTSIADSQLTNAVSQARMYLQFDDGV